MTNKILTGSFAGAGHSNNIPIYGQFNFTLSGDFSANIAIQRKFSDSNDWHTISKDAQGNSAIFMTPVSLIINEVERAVAYRVNCLSFTSGPVEFRISK